MGQKSAGESLAAIIQAFSKRRTWQQAELARHVELGVPALRKRLLELRASGMPLSDERETPHVYWSVPRNWFPGGVALSGPDVEVLLRLLGRMPKSQGRDRIVRALLDCLPGGRDDAEAVVAPRVSSAEDKFLSAVEDAAARKRSLRFRYYSASRGADSVRHASVHRVFVGPPSRFVATCHRSGALKWFRVDNVFDASVDPATPFRVASESEVDELVAGSIDGFFDPRARRQRHVFVVREPEARWVAKNLLAGMRVEQGPDLPPAGGALGDGLRIVADTTSVNPLARYVVGLGEAARAETEALRGEVARLARGALRWADGPGETPGTRPRGRVRGGRRGRVRGG